MLLISCLDNENNKMLWHVGLRCRWSFCQIYLLMDLLSTPVPAPYSQEHDTSYERTWHRLGLYPTELNYMYYNRIVISEQFFFNFSEYSLLDHLQLLLLYQAVVTLYPTYSGVLPPQNIIDMVIAHNGDHMQNFPLQAAMEKGMGGTSYVWTRLLTKLGHFIGNH